PSQLLSLSSLPRPPPRPPLFPYTTLFRSHIRAQPHGVFHAYGRAARLAARQRARAGDQRRLGSLARRADRFRRSPDGAPLPGSPAVLQHEADESSLRVRAVAAVAGFGGDVERGAPRNGRQRLRDAG